MCSAIKSLQVNGMPHFRSSAIGAFAAFLLLMLIGGWATVEAGMPKIEAASALPGLCIGADEHEPGSPVHHCRVAESARLVGKTRERSRLLLSHFSKRHSLVPPPSELAISVPWPSTTDWRWFSTNDGAPFFAMLAQTTRNLN